MAENNSLTHAQSAKQDEFYTQLSDIEAELKHYKKYFKDKVVFCNCDDPYESNFFKYFALNFNRLKLKRLIATCYSGSPIAGMQPLFDDADDEVRIPYMAVVNTVHDTTGEGGIDMLDVAELFHTGENQIKRLDGNGDFRSEECVRLLDEADIVCTNPPFSLFREYIAQLMEHEKKFIIIGNQNAVTYKEVFPLIKDNKLWFGYYSGNMEFRVPDEYEAHSDNDHRFWTDENGKKWRSIGTASWFTNLDTTRRHDEMILVKRYKGNEDGYPQYDNYDAINVDKVTDIPCDYTGLMGVPLTFLYKYNPEQFEILDARSAALNNKQLNKNTMLIKDADSAINGKPKYVRVLIRNKQPEVLV